MKFDEYNSIGCRLLRRRAITEDDLEKATRRQEEVKSQTGKKPRLGDVLVEMGACSREVVEEEAKHQTKAAVKPDTSKLDDALADLERATTATFFAAATIVPKKKDEKNKDLNDTKPKLATG